MRSMILIAVTLFSLLLLAGCGGGESGGTPAGASGAVEGTVYIPLAAADTQAAAAPLGYKALASVQVAVGTNTIATDAAGHFLLSGLPVGAASVTLTPPAGGGYQALTLPVNITADTTLQLGKVSLLSTGSSALALTLNRRDTATAGQVRLYLSAVDAGAPVMGLGGQNFTCQVNGAAAVPTALAQQCNVAAPVSIALVLDRSTTMSGAKLTTMKAAAVDFISKMRTQDEVEIVSLGGTAGYKVELAYSSDKVALTATVNALTAAGDPPFFDAVYQASLDTSLRPAGNNKAVLAITDGGEVGNTHYTTATALGDYLKTLNVPVYCIGLSIQHDNTRDSKLAYQDEDDLALIAFKSHGEYFYTADSTTLPATVQRVLIRLQQQYIITLPVTGALTGLSVNVTAGTHTGVVVYP